MIKGLAALRRHLVATRNPHYGMAFQNSTASFAPPLRRARTDFEALGRAALSWLSCAAIAVMLGVSAMVLGNWGWSYESPGGSVLEKLHPASWIIFGSFLLATAGSGNPVRFLAAIVTRQPGIFVFFVSLVVALAQLTLVLKASFTPIIDTFFMPMLLAVLIARMGERAKRHTAILIHLMFAANGALGLYEFLTGFRLTPYVAGTLLIEGDWRSTALFGHPLANASLTASYIIAMCAGGGRELPAFARLASIGLLIAAMVTFGGRSSLVILLVFVAVAALRNAAGWLVGTKISLPGAAAAAILVPLLLAGLWLVWQGGFFDRLAERFADDNGSANARILLLRLFERVSWPDLLFGPDQARLAALQQQEGIFYGLESFWLATILAFGLIVALILFTGLFCFCGELVRATRPGAWQVPVFFFIIASTAVSLSAKTHIFGIMVAIMLVLLRKPASQN